MLCRASGGMKPARRTTTPSKAPATRDTSEPEPWPGPCVCSGRAAESDLHKNDNGKTALLAFAVVGLCTESAWAQAPPVEHGSFSILVENDLFYRSDRDYSSGVEFAYTTAPDETPDILVATARGLSGLFSSGEVRASYELGQDIFTPAATQLANPPLTQRPYAGFLWAGVAILTKDAQRLNQLEMQVGVIGPASLAANAQIFTHSILGEPKPQGWHYQLRDEPALQFTYERTYKIIPPRSGLGLVFDVEPHLVCRLLLEKKNKNNNKKQ